MIVADSVYRGREREVNLRERGFTCEVALNPKRGQKTLPPVIERINRAIARVRALVERPFVWMKAMGDRCVRYRGRRRIEVDFVLILVACNIKTSPSLQQDRSRAA